MCRLLFMISLLLCSTNSLATNKFVKGAIFDNQWQADFSSKNLDTWSYILHPHGIRLLPIPNEPNNIAAYFEVKGNNSYLWRGHEELNRVELQYKPLSTPEAGTTVVSWRFMLPELFSRDRHQIAYWESDGSYQQSFRLQLNAENLTLVSSTNNKEMWRMSGIKPQQWYFVSLKIIWSTSEGSVQVKIDNELQGNFVMPTLIDENENMFFQLGILRHKSERIEALWVDDVTVKNLPLSH